jgi:selenocysteine lyase/cysteine desulfurase
MPTPAEPLADQRALFEIDDEVAYFNTANLGPLLRGAREAGEQALARRARPWQIGAADWFDEAETLRARFAQLIGAGADEIALVPATSYGLAAVARNVEARAGERILVLDAEYPSSYYTWQRLAARTGAELLVVERESGQAWTEAILAAVDERVALAAVPNVHWTDGAIVELGPVGEALRAVDATFVVDASQSAGAMPLDVGVLRPDAVVTVGYKWLLGSLSLGFLYLDERFHHGEPLEENWILRSGSEDFAALVDYPQRYQPGARRFDVGQRSSFQLVPIALAALEQILDWQVPRIAATLERRTSAISTGAEGLGLTAPSPGERGPHLLGLHLPRETAGRISAALAEAGVFAAVRGESLRISPHLHTDDRDVERLLAALATAL